jgi:hypothetical protein
MLGVECLVFPFRKMSLKAKTELAVLSVILTQASGLPSPVVINPLADEEVGFALLPGQTHGKIVRQTPCCTVNASGSREEPLHTGNFKFRVLVGIWGSADKSTDTDPDPAEVHAANVKAITDVMDIDRKTLCPLLSNAVGQFHCFGKVAQGQVAHEPEKRTFVDLFSYELTVCESDM